MKRIKLTKKELNSVVSFNIYADHKIDGIQQYIYGTPKTKNPDLLFLEQKISELQKDNMLSNITVDVISHIQYKCVAKDFFNRNYITYPIQLKSRIVKIN